MSNASIVPAAVPQPPDQRLLRRDAILKAAVHTGECMAEPAPWQELVPEALRILGEATDVSRVYVFEVFRDAAGTLLASQRFEWCAPGIEPQIDVPELQNVDFLGAGYTRWMELLEAGLPVAGDIQEFPESERPLLEMQAILSICVQPIFVGHRWWGFIGFDACTQLQHWEAVEVDVLRIAAQTIGSTLFTQRRERMLLQSQKMEALGRMAGSTAHDFNNALAALGSGIELLESDLGDSGQITPDRAELLGILRRALDQAGGLTRRLLDFSRHREGVPRVFRIATFVADLLPLLRQAAGSRIRVSMVEADASADAHAAILLDPVQLEQVMMNLVVNARDSMPTGGAITIGCRALSAEDDPAQGDAIAPGQWTMLSVRDTGEGMTSDVKERIFEPFFTTKAPDKGTGLGLATIYSIIDGAHGHIRVSSAPGAGTEFRLYFPAATLD